MSARHVAIVGVGRSEFSKDSGVGPGTLVTQAARAAIQDSGVARDDIDGVVGVYSTDLPTLWPGYVVDALGLRNVKWWDSVAPPSVVALSSAVHAVAAGNCEYAVCYHGKYRWANTSRSNAQNVFRQPPAHDFDPSLDHALVESAGSFMWSSRVMQMHMDRYGSTRNDFARLAVNNRTHALANPRAVFREPLTVDNYLAAPMIDSPMCLLDMDAPIDGAMAVVVTSAERAGDCDSPPIYVECFGSALPYRNDGLYWPEADERAARDAVCNLFARTDLNPQDIDLAYPYDGFTILAMLWLEALYTQPGEGVGFLQDNWDEDEQRLNLFGRVPVCTHGGNLSEGRATQGFGHVLEAVEQLRGTAQTPQVAGNPQTAVITNGMAGTNRSVILNRNMSGS